VTVLWAVRMERFWAATTQSVAMVERPRGVAVTTPPAHHCFQVFPKAVGSSSRCSRCHVGSPALDTYLWLMVELFLPLAGGSGWLTVLNVRTFKAKIMASA